MFSLDKLLKGDNLKYVLGAVALGVGGAYLLSKKNASSNYTIPSNLVQGQVNTYYPYGANRSFTDLSDEKRWNALPLPDVEIAVPFDTFDRFATIQGSYGEDYSYVGTPS